MGKRLWSALAATTILGLALAAHAAAADSPGGFPQGGLDQGTEVTVLEEAGDWVKVSVVGWVLKSRFSGSNQSAAGSPEGTAQADPDKTTPSRSVSATGVPDVASSVSYIGEGFNVRNVTFSESATGVTKVRGEVQNGSGKNYSTVVLTVTAFDQGKAIVGVGHAVMVDASRRTGEAKTCRS